MPVKSSAASITTTHGVVNTADVNIQGFTINQVFGYARAMSFFMPLADVAPQDIWNGVVARTVNGQRLSFAIVELAADSVVDEHQHPNEQIGIVLTGTLSFTIGGETRSLRAGDTYNIPGGVPHHAQAGPAGAVVVDVFAPVRDDWSRFEKRAPRAPVWP
jgi:quercetin dioxygenase-like cupin family protein